MEPSDFENPPLSPPSKQVGGRPLPRHREVAGGRPDFGRGIGWRVRCVASHPEAAAGAEPATMSGDVGPTSTAPHPEEVQPGSGVHLVVEFCEPCGFEAAYLELESAVKEQYPGIQIESRTGGRGAFEIQINGQLVFSKLENGGFPYEKDLIEAIRRAINGEPLEKITNSRPPCVIL